MSQSIEANLSDAEYQLIHANQLGTPLRIYRLRSDYIRMIRRISLLIFIAGIVILIVVIIISAVQWHRESTGSYIGFLLFAPFPLSSGLAGLCGLLGGLLGLCIGVPRAQNEHIVICKNGLLQVGKELRGKHAGVVHWRDIRTIEKSFAFQEYSIICRIGKVIRLSFYQDIEEIIAFIRQQSDVV
jgi:hypothetical protein